MEAWSWGSFRAESACRCGSRSPVSREQQDSLCAEVALHAPGPRGRIVTSEAARQLGLDHLACDSDDLTQVHDGTQFSVEHVAAQLCCDLPSTAHGVNTCSLLLSPRWMCPASQASITPRLDRLPPCQPLHLRRCHASVISCKLSSLPVTECWDTFPGRRPGFLFLSCLRGGVSFEESRKRHTSDFCGDGRMGGDAPSPSTGSHVSGVAAHTRSMAGRC